MGYWSQGERVNNGKFLVEELLGSGGFGVTYRVRETQKNKQFAIKTLNELARNKPNFLQLQVKFINEAIALASCQHPNIVKVYPKGFQEGELWCMVMEYVEGENLARHIDMHGKFAEQQAIEIITNIGNALEIVHQQNLLHRDIKPGNILLRNSDATPVLIDFGLAREYNSHSDSIQSMTNQMTECYAPPEQYQTKGIFGAWTDVYALAATLYVLVTKEIPFPARFRTHADLIPPQKYSPELSDRTQAAILKGMALEPSDRPQSIKAWLNLLYPEPKKKTKPIVLDEKLPTNLEILEFDTVRTDDRGQITNTERYFAEYFAEYIGGGIFLDLVRIPGGTFLMGSPKTEPRRHSHESPQHQVTLPSFYMGRFLVTQAQWQQVATLPKVKVELSPDPSNFKGEYLPVESISWYSAIEFCQRLSAATGKNYRLPSEAEWEYACRAKTTTPFYFGETITTKLVNFSGDSNYTYGKAPKGQSRKTTTTVGSFPPNNFGLWDMHGNVWEWCADSWHENYWNAPRDNTVWQDPYSKNVILRGGSWSFNPDCCRSAFRGRGNPAGFNFSIGFRCVVDSIN